jgi:hypothetical protein
MNFEPKGAELDPLADLGLPKLRRRALGDHQLLRLLYSVTALALIYAEHHEREQTKCLEPGDFHGLGAHVYGHMFFAWALAEHAEYVERKVLEPVRDTVLDMGVFPLAVACLLQKELSAPNNLAALPRSQAGSLRELFPGTATRTAIAAAEVEQRDGVFEPWWRAQMDQLGSYFHRQHIADLVEVWFMAHGPHRCLAPHSVDQVLEDLQRAAFSGLVEGINRCYGALLSKEREREVIDARLQEDLKAAISKRCEEIVEEIEKWEPCYASRRHLLSPITGFDGTRALCLGLINEVKENRRLPREYAKRLGMALTFEEAARRENINPQELYNMQRKVARNYGKRRKGLDILAKRIGLR